ncbi:multicomponent Na+:H+ antiporter subunit B [Clostridiales Family XIII bacterium PM5-7]
MKSSKRKILAMVLLTAIIIFAWGLIDYLPAIGDPNSAPNQHISKIYIEMGPEETDSPNLVTAVFADYRGFDTFLESAVMFLATFCVAMVLIGRPKKNKATDLSFLVESFGGPYTKVIMAMIIPIVLLYAAYAFFHGEVSLGGGFQAGTLIALSYVLYTLVTDREVSGIHLTQPIVIGIGAIGVLLYGFTGLLPLFFGGKFLEYTKLPFAAEETAQRHSMGIMFIEIGVAICVMAAIITMLEAVLERNKLHERIK